jgi:hypothetical protein
MTRTIFGRRQAVLRQRARQESWRLALREELTVRTLANQPSEEIADRFDTEPVRAVTLGSPSWKTRP